MKIEWFLAWWNLIYTVPFLLAVAYLAIYATSGLTFGDADADADAHVEPDAHMDVHADVDTDVHADVHLDPHAEIDADADVDADAHLDTDADAHIEADHDHNVETDHDGHVAHAPAHSHGGQATRGAGAASFLSWLGLGRVPMSLILMVLMLTWGMVGFVVNRTLTSVVPADWMVLLASLPLAAISSLAVTRTTVRLMARWMPTTETYARPLAKLVGATGRALYPIDERFGMASVRDQHGDLFQIACRVYPDRQPINKGDEVLLVDFDVSRNLFYVAQYDLERPVA